MFKSHRVSDRPRDRFVASHLDRLLAMTVPGPSSGRSAGRGGGETPASTPSRAFRLRAYKCLLPLLFRFL